MSFDPFGENVQPQQNRPPVDQGRGDPDYPQPTSRAADQAKLPGIFLLITGVLNLILAVAAGGVGFTFANIPEDKLGQIEQQMAKDQPKQLEQMKAQGFSMKDIMKIYTYSGYGAGVCALIAGLLGIIAGICMMAMRGYGMAIFGAVVTALPCISLMSCPCLLGMISGIYAVTVLLNADVRAGFR